MDTNDSDDYDMYIIFTCIQRRCLSSAWSFPVVLPLV